MFNIDLKGRRRGKCLCGKCDEFMLRNMDITYNGWCQYCNHPPVDHEEIEDKSAINAVHSPIHEQSESANESSYMALVVQPGSSTEGPTQHETIPSQHQDYISDDGLIYTNEVSADNQACASKPLSNKGSGKTMCFQLPEFSNVLKPLLEGETLSKKDHAVLSSILKEELIAYLNRENLICNANSTSLRWQYRNLGESLASKYPRMLFDLPSSRQKKTHKENAPIYSVFIRRLSQRRKMQRLRQKNKDKTSTQHAVDVAVVEVVEVSPEDALCELKSVTSEAAKNSENVERINDLLKISYDIRRKEDISELPPFLMSQTYLETEVELRLASSMAEMEAKTQKALMKMSTIYSVPGTILEMEKLMEPKRATWNAITMGDYTSEQERPGPSIFFGSDKVLLCKKHQIVRLENECPLERAAILLLGLYYIFNLNFPAAYGQFLGLLQNIVVEGKKFPRHFSTNHLIQITKNLC